MSANAPVYERGHHAQTGIHFQHINQVDQPILVLVENKIPRDTEHDILYLVARVKAELKGQYPDKTFGIAPYQTEDVLQPLRLGTKTQVTAYLIYEQ